MPVAAHGDVWNDAHVALADNLHELHYGVALGTECFDAHAIRLRLGSAGRANGFGLATGTQSCRLRFTGGLLDVGVRLQFSDVHALLGTDDLLLDVGERGLSHE